MKLIVDPDKVRDTRAYSPALKFGDFVMVAGQAPISTEGKIVNGTIEEETRLTMNNVKKLIETAGATMDQVVQCNCFLSSLADFDPSMRRFASSLANIYPVVRQLGRTYWALRLK